MTEPAGLAGSLRQLRAIAGQPTITCLATIVGASRSAVSDAFSGRRRPARWLTLALVAELGGDQQEWAVRWDELDAALRPTGRCEVDGCPNNKPRGRYCSTHQRHAQLYGDPLIGRFSPKTHPDTCTVDGCDRPYRSRGMCRSHYERARRNATYY